MATYRKKSVISPFDSSYTLVSYSLMINVGTNKETKANTMLIVKYMISAELGYGISPDIANPKNKLKIEKTNIPIGILVFLIALVGGRVTVFFV
ncbi:hypothetical protein [Bacillus haynesii]|uniref:hypothetical protein n=1 Tax=Bacillus haynesii TaxID=1925021 RepID=UPI001F618916|nr:hypothetical protein [Bacillus haynesii]MCI4127654.1 hypothetical protein [Bacillus haynesii]